MEESVELTHRVVNAIALVSVEEALRLCDPEVEFVTLLDLPDEAPPFLGHDGLRRWFKRVDELWAFIEVRDWKVEEQRGDWVLASGSARMRGRGSPNVIELQWTAAGKAVDGRVVKFGLYLNRADAIRAIEADRLGAT